MSSGFHLSYSESEYVAAAADSNGYQYQGQHVAYHQPQTQYYGAVQCKLEDFGASSLPTSDGAYYQQQQQYYDPEYEQHYASSAHGFAGYPYASQSAYPIPAAPPEPYPAKQNESGYGLAAPSGAQYTAFAHSVPTDHYHADYAPFAYSAHQHDVPASNTYAPQTTVAPIAVTQRGSSSSSLADALRSPIISPARVALSSSPAPSLAAPSTPDSNIDSNDSLVAGVPSAFTFVLESGPECRTGDAPVAPAGPPRKKRSPPKARKEQGFLACYFCRGRKIACNPGAGSTTCDQCTKRQLVCEYPTESRRGQRGLGGSGRGLSVSRRERHEAHLSARQQLKAPRRGHDHDAH